MLSIPCSISFDRHWWLSLCRSSWPSTTCEYWGLHYLKPEQQSCSSSRARFLVVFGHFYLSPSVRFLDWFFSPLSITNWNNLRRHLSGFDWSGWQWNHQETFIRAWGRGRFHWIHSCYLSRSQSGAHHCHFPHCICLPIALSLLILSALTFAFMFPMIRSISW